MAQHLDITAHGELVVRPPGLEALRRHLRAADARAAQAGPAPAQATEQQAGKQVARGFAGDQGQSWGSGGHRG